MCVDRYKSNKKVLSRKNVHLKVSVSNATKEITSSLSLTNELPNIFSVCQIQENTSLDVNEIIFLNHLLSI